ncbi:MAG: hypothetical protein RLY93_17635 [Sumerlaeia bacterium]
MFKRKRAEALRKAAPPRRIRIHSVTPQPAGAARPVYFRVAFEFLDPPGPWTLQFFEVGGDQASTLQGLEPGAETRFWESDDEARTRVMETPEGEALWPR